MAVREITMTVNGGKYTVAVKPNETLLQVLRDKLQFTGVKEGCGTGDCGACTVIYNGKTATSCLILAVEADGADITTVEGLAKDGQLHPVQQAFVEEGAIQCGYCTPGMVLSGVQLLNENPNPTEKEIRKGIGGNICRCTGYVKIVKAIQKAAQNMQEGGQK